MIPTPATGCPLVHLVGQLRQGGAERQLASLAALLRERGWSQSVVSFDVGGCWKEHLIGNGIPVVEIGRRTLKPLRSWALYMVLRQQKPAVLLSWTGTSAFYGECIRWCRRPHHVFNVRCDHRRKRSDGLFGRVRPHVRYVLRHADYIVSNAQASVSVLEREHIQLPGYRVIRNIVSPGKAARPDNAIEIPRVVILGSLLAVKNVDLLLRAMAALKCQRVLCKLTVAGDGPEGPRLRALAASLGLTDAVDFRGHVENVADLLASVHIAVHASRSEGLSNAVLEAMGAGLPVVATAVGGTPEVVAHEGTGLLIPPNDVHSMTEALRRLVLEPELRGRLGLAARCFVEATCNGEAIADQYTEVLRNVIAA